MNKRERVEAVFGLNVPDRIPFVPAVYEHKARLIGRSPSQVCRSTELLEQALRAELQLYDPDLLTVGMDVYNVEAEAMGCRVRYFDESNDVPGIVDTPISDLQHLSHTALPDPESSGRMPLFIGTAEKLHKELGQTVVVRGAVTGPFTLLSELSSLEQVLFLAIDDPDVFRRLLARVARVTIDYGCAFACRGVQPVLFDSRATPALISPRIFREFVMPVYRDFVVPALKTAGAWHIPLIIGGDTTGIIAELIDTGATQLLCDFEGNVPVFLEQCRKARVPFRANVDPRLLHKGSIEEIQAAGQAILSEGRTYPGFLFGCGVVPYDCDPERVRLLREMV